MSLGTVYFLQGKMNQAIFEFKEIVAVEPLWAEAQNILGVALTRQGSLKEAIRHFSEALRVKPDYAEAHNNLERCLRLIGKSTGGSNSGNGGP